MSNPYGEKDECGYHCFIKKAAVCMLLWDPNVRLHISSKDRGRYCVVYEEGIKDGDWALGYVEIKRSILSGLSAHVCCAFVVVLFDRRGMSILEP